MTTLGQTIGDARKRIEAEVVEAAIPSAAYRVESLPRLSWEVAVIAHKGIEYITVHFR